MRCPICNAAIKAEMKPFRPFCSARCKTIDLGKWVNEEYRFQVEPSDSEDEEPLDPTNLPRPIGDA